MRLIHSLALILALACSQAMAATAASKTATSDGVFTSVSGKVQAKKKGKKARAVKNGSTVRAGEKITTAKDSKAVLRFFDGSELKVSPKTEFTISKLEKAGAKDKVMQFKLAVGGLWANVKKLTSSKSSFEIESGGVVCGVRGTQYSYNYDPATGKVTVHVNEGSVFINSNGHTYVFTAGQTAVLNNGVLNTSDQSSSGDETEGSSSLADLNQQFGNGLSVNGDNTLTDPGVEGSVKINISANVAPGEAVP